MSNTDAGEPIVSLQDVEVHFEDNSFLSRDAEVVKAVDGVDLDIFPNDVVALVGESGCGKTTLGKTAIGLQRPTAGAVYFQDQDIWDAKDGTGTVHLSYESIRRSLQIVHQDPGSSLNPNRTVLANLQVPLKQYRPDMSVAEREATVKRLLDRIGMKPNDDYAKRFPHELSGGEQQRVALGRAILMRPALILADEAVSALDVSLRVEMMDFMLELHELFDTAYLFISHDFANARYLAKKTDGRIGIMYLGKLVEIGPVDQVLKNPKHPYTKSLIWSAPTIHPERAKASQGEEVPLRRIDIPSPSDVPSGCNFHTRCPRIIPPDDIDIEQEAYNDIVDFRIDLQNEDLEEGFIWDELDFDPNREDIPESAIDAFVSTLYDREFDVVLDEPHKSRVEAAMEDIARGEREAAIENLREYYESICEREFPEYRTDHPVACHLYEESGSIEPSGDADGTSYTE